MSRQDIHNIQYQLNLQCIEKHSNDYMSVSAWVAEMQDLAYNPVLVFKNQGDEQGDECDNIGRFFTCISNRISMRHNVAVW